MIKRVLKDQAGFTLIEMLIVVILLGILAMLIIPQISVSTADANINTLQSNLASLRNAIELYYHQHNEVYPGAVSETDGSTATTNANADEAFIAQLTQYTDINGQTSTSKTGNFIYGPYLKSTALPTNPFNNLSTLACDVAIVDVTDRTLIAPETAWAFHPVTGVFFANDTDGHNNL
ncbi:MAG: type II secretion system protein [Desulfobacterales bacterium]|jgi:prepilin-type N-terminal cleavage/methylation domain-containing protein